MSQHKSVDTVIVGAGITGLTAAFYLQKAGRDFLVLEEKNRVGGVIRSIRENGFIYETGPNTGVLGQPEAAVLFEDIGSRAELEMADDTVKKRYILKDGCWEPLPSGLIPAINTPLFTKGDKLRILGEPFRSRGKEPEESLADMVMRRMGKSFLDYAVDPFILGVYAGDPHTLIPKYALPKLYHLEQRYGSFIGGAIKKKFEKQSDLGKKASRKVFSFKGGLQSLVDALYHEAGKERFRLNSREVSIRKKDNDFRISFTKEINKKEVYTARNVIITTGAHMLPSLLPDINPAKINILTDIRYAKVIEVALGFEKWVGMKLDGFGGLIPFKEKRNLLGILFLSAFLSGRAPAGGALFTLFLGGVRRPEIFEKPDQEIVDLVTGEFTGLMGTDHFSPDLLKIFRHEWAIPQYERSSRERFRMIEEVEKDLPGLCMRGNFAGGIGLADRIKQGKIAADVIISR